MLLVLWVDIWIALERFIENSEIDTLMLKGISHVGLVMIKVVTSLGQLLVMLIMTMLDIWIE